MAKKQLDLSSFKVQNKNLLDKTEETASVEKKIDAIVEQMNHNQTENKQPQVGRPPKQRSEKASKPITLKFTESEFQKITDMAGDVPLATYLKKQLQGSGLL